MALTNPQIFARPESAKNAAESELMDVLTDWIHRHYKGGGDFSLDAIAAAGEAGLTALRSGFSMDEAFESARGMYFLTLRLHQEEKTAKGADS